MSWWDKLRSLFAIALVKILSQQFFSNKDLILHVMFDVVHHTQSWKLLFAYCKMQLSACFKHLADNVGTPIMSLNVHAVSK